MKFGRLNHVAIAYKQAEQASHLFKSLGYKVSEKIVSNWCLHQGTS